VSIREIREGDWGEWPGCKFLRFTAPAGMEDSVGTAESLVDHDAHEVHVPWQPDELDVARLARGGTVWLTIIGQLPPHRLEVRGGDRCCSGAAPLRPDRPPERPPQVEP
jgi:hypothetical protein